MQAVEQWPLARFVEYAGNPRINDHAVAQAAAAIKEFGFRVPILAKSSGLIVDGHLRLKAARQLGLQTVPVLLADDMTDVQIKAFRISVNKIAGLATWNDGLLALELADLSTMGFDITTIGFDAAEYASLRSSAAPPLNTSPQLTDGFKYSVMIACADEIEQGKMLQRFESEGLQCRPLITQ